VNKIKYLNSDFIRHADAAHSMRNIFNWSKLPSKLSSSFYHGMTVFGIKEHFFECLECL
jgi:hypothetical protein